MRHSFWLCYETLLFRFTLTNLLRLASESFVHLWFGHGCFWKSSLWFRSNSVRALSVIYHVYILWQNVFDVSAFGIVFQCVLQAAHHKVKLAVLLWLSRHFIIHLFLILIISNNLKNAQILKEKSAKTRKWCKIANFQSNIEKLKLCIWKGARSFLKV